jgi:hypothetical protein
VGREEQRAQLGRHDQERGELRDPQRHGHRPLHAEGAQGGERTVLVPNPNWWDKPTHNLTEVIFTPVANPATRVAAIKAGDIDMMYEVPPADTESLKKEANVAVLEGPETRVVFLGMDQERDELLESNVKGKNPFKDKRVREAFHRSIDVDAIKRTVMRGQSFPTDLMVAPGINGYVKELDKRPALLKPEEAKKLLADAGLSQRLRGRHGLPQRPLRQRREDLPGRGGDAGRDRREGESAGADPQPLLRQDPAQVGRQAGRDQLLHAGLVAGQHLRRPQRLRGADPDAERRRQEGHVQCRRLFQPRRSTSSPTPWSRRPTRPSATR